MNSFQSYHPNKTLQPSSTYTVPQISRKVARQDRWTSIILGELAKEIPKKNHILPTVFLSDKSVLRSYIQRDIRRCPWYNYGKPFGTFAYDDVCIGIDRQKTTSKTT